MPSHALLLVRYVLFAVLVGLSSHLFAEPPKSEQLAGRIAEVINGPDYKHAHWGLLVVDLDSGETVYELNADKLFAPASTTKLFSTATALDTLGADFRFETPVFRIGDVGERGELLGDLIVVASGDLTFGGRTDGHDKIVFKDSDHTYANGNTTAELTDPDPLAGINELARQVHAAGIRRVRGDVLIDDRLFDKAEGSGSGPSSLTPIIVNDNVIDIIVTPASPGEPARVTSRPETSLYQIDALVDTVEKGADTRVNVARAGSGRITVRGQIPIGHKPLVRVHEVDDAAAFARGLFIESLRRTGVIVDASPLAPQSNRLPRPAADQLKQIATLRSPPFSEEIKLILKVSHNLHASTLPLLVATKHGRRSLADGLRYQHDFLARVGVDVDTISFGGGAGGSRADYSTPRATVQLLRAMSKRPDFAVYEAALPVLGVDGTLTTSVAPDSPARGKVQAKTGTLYWDNVMNGRFVVTSKALAGYMTTSHDRRLAFAMFVNNTHIQKSSETSREGKTLGRLCEIIVAEQ
jgi:D-alanyl-D-alanine carboxypeptidase/D-alanyl-D-alanine-endopeptidase (penicillin-binding protein 4)